MTVAYGGIGDIYIIQGLDPKSISTQYQKYIVGQPYLPPLWSMGWNQCKWGYKTVEYLEWVVGNYTANNIPLDVQWSDIDYLSNYRDFTYDDVRFATLP